MNAELERSYGVSLRLRTGVNTGEVVTGTAERLVTGDAVNVAARLEQAAEPGDILIGASTRKGIAVELMEEWAKELKGQKEFFKTLEPYLPNELLEEFQKLGQRLSR